MQIAWLIIETVLITIGICHIIAYIFNSSKSNEPQTPPPKVVYLSPRAYLERQTYIHALRGDRHARDWIAQRLYEQSKDQSRKQQQSQNQRRQHQEQKKINCTLRQEGISALKSLGHSKKEAVAIIDSLILSKNYSNTEELIKDAFRKN